MSEYGPCGLTRQDCAREEWESLACRRASLPNALCIVLAYTSVSWRQLPVWAQFRRARCRLVGGGAGGAEESLSDDEWGNSATIRALEVGCPPRPRPRR